MVIHRNHKALSSVDHSCLYKIHSVRIYFDHNIRCLDIELSCLCDITCQKRCFLACIFFEVLLKVLHLLIRHTALLENLLHIRFIQCQRIRFFFVFFDHIIQCLVNVADSLVITIFSQCIFNNHLECLFLCIRRHRHLRTKKLVDHLRLKIF